MVRFFFFQGPCSRKVRVLHQSIPMRGTVSAWQARAVWVLGIGCQARCIEVCGSSGQRRPVGHGDMRIRGRGVASTWCAYLCLGKGGIARLQPPSGGWTNGSGGTPVAAMPLSVKPRFQGPSHTIRPPSCYLRRIPHRRKTVDSRRSARPKSSTARSSLSARWTGSCHTSS